MPTSVKSAFEKFYENINLSGDHRDVARARKDRIISLLKDNFEIIEAFPTGSIPRFTAIKERADVDVMVVMHHGKHIKDKTPKEVLQSVRDALVRNKTVVRKNGQAVTLYFKTWPNVDIVPVSRNTEGGITVSYNVPNMNIGKWIISKPNAHNKVIEDRVAKSGGIFRRLVKILKYWNYTHGAWLSSYHLEAMACRIFSDVIIDEYGWNIFQFFEEGIDLLKNDMYYLGNKISGYLDDNSKAEIIRRFENARDKSRSAWLAINGNSEDPKKAIEQWKLIFGDRFPNYE